MGLIVLFITAPIWIPAVIILLVLGLKVDEWFNHQPPHQRRMYCYDEIDTRDIDEDCYDEYVDDFSHSYIDETEHYESSSSDSGLYGGLPYGDGEIFIVDNEDMIDQMDF